MTRATAERGPNVDILIRGARVHDGERFLPPGTVVGIKGGTVVRADAASAASLTAREAIDADSLILSPAFIDIHNHGDLRAMTRDGVNLLSQGAAAAIVGNCGFSPWGPCGNNPVFLEDRPPAYLARAEGRLASASDYFVALESAGLPVNIASLAGLHALLPEEGMADRLDEALDAGCIGLSVGLNYEHQDRIKEPHIVELGRRLARRGRCRAGICWHLRSQGAMILDAVREVIRVHEQAGTPCHINHLKKVGGDPDDLRRALDLIAPYPGITVDMYPYVEGWSVLSQPISVGRRLLGEGASARDAALAVCEGCWHAVVPVSGVEPQMIGRSIADISRTLARPEIEVYLELVERYPDATACYMDQSDSSNLRTLFAFERSLVGSDGHIYSVGEPGHHPRSFGAFSRFFASCRDQGWMTIEQAIRKLTSEPADRFGLAGRGRIRDGAPADLCLFHPGGFSDRAAFSEPNRLSTGVRSVFLNGVLAYDGRRVTARAGSVLR